MLVGQHFVLLRDYYDDDDNEYRISHGEGETLAEPPVRNRL
jgi:hypothetical protein